MEQYLTDFWQNHSTNIVNLGYKALLVILVLGVCFFVAKGVHRWIARTNEKFERFDATIVPVLNTVSSFSIYTVGIVVILDYLGVNTTSIIALMGAAGLGIALALKDTLSNIASGIMLLIIRPFRVGNFIECGSISGTIKEVGLFTTVLETPDGIFISAPNSVLWGDPIKNFSRNAMRRMDITVGISYTDSIDVGFDVLQKIVSNEPRFLETPAPKIILKEMADSSINIQLRAWATTEQYWDVYWITNKNIKEQIEQAGLTIPFPQRDVHIFNSSH